MRGEDGDFNPPAGVPVWITPACAGKTRLVRPALGHRQDHPRMRGEDVAACSSNDP